MHPPARRAPSDRALALNVGKRAHNFPRPARAIAASRRASRASASSERDASAVSATSVNPAGNRLSLACAETSGGRARAVWGPDESSSSMRATRPTDAATGRERSYGVAELRDGFLPSGFPSTVSADYADWLRWQLVSLLFRDILEIMSAQSLLVALGMGSTPGALPLTAAAKWVLKDGVGSFATLLAGAFGGQWYDEDPKRWWGVSNALEEVARAIELVTPAAPGLFLPLAASATFVRSAALTGRGSLLNGTFMQHFGRNNNLGDVRAKLEVQGRWLALVALPLGIQVFQLVSSKASELAGEGDEFGAFSVACAGYGVVIGAHVLACWQAARSLKFDSLNRFRLLKLAEAYVSSDGSKELPDCVEIGDVEGVYKPRRTATTPTLGAAPDEIGATWDAFTEAVRVAGGRAYVLGFDPKRADVVSALLVDRARARDILAAALACEKVRFDASSIVDAYRYADERVADFELSLIRSGWKVNFVQTGTAPVFSLNVVESEGVA